MERVIERYLETKERNNFTEFLKQSGVWICLVNNYYNKCCSVHPFLIEAEQVLMQSGIKKEKVDDFLNLQKKKKKYFFSYMIFMLFQKNKE